MASHTTVINTSQILRGFSDDVEFLWRLARATRDRAMVLGVPDDQKKALVYEAFGYAEKALEKDDSCFASHKVSKAHPPSPLCVNMNCRR